MGQLLPPIAEYLIDEHLRLTAETLLRRASMAERLAAGLSKSDQSILVRYADECRAKVRYVGGLPAKAA